MLTKLRIQNFKQFENVEIELGQSVVFIGPNNSGKTTALQALALWRDGVNKWLDPTTAHFDVEVGGFGFIENINRYDLTALPVPGLSFLWRNLKTLNAQYIDLGVEVEGYTENKVWHLALKFRYENEEVLDCSLSDRNDVQNLDVVPKIVFLPAMSGLVSTEPQIQPGRINVLIGEGRTAEVLRNLCLQLYESFGRWDKVVSYMKQQFGIELLPPQYLPNRGEIRMSYKDRSGVMLDLSSAGRGMLQILLLLAYMYNNPGAVLLLDEPDAHLEILRQREIYTLLKSVALEQGSQIIIATHSEVIMDNAAKDKDTIVAFVGQPHQVRKLSDLRKSLTLVPTSDYYLAERKRWILYLEDSTDFEILRAFAAHLGHEAADFLELAFVKDIENNEPQIAKIHFTGLQEGTPDLIGIALFDRISEGKLTENVPPGLSLFAWRRREIENYFILPEALIAYARNSGDDGDQHARLMQELIELLIPPIALNDLNNRWWMNTKATDDFLDQLFSMYFERLKLPLLLRKADYYRLVQFMPKDKIDPEITEKLDAIVEVAQRAQPRKDNV